MNLPLKIAVVVYHPIQHFCPQYASFANNNAINLKVFFASTLGYKKYFDPSFGQEISWNLPLHNFNHEFLNGDSVIKVDKTIDAPKLDHALEGFAPDLLIVYGYFQKLQRRAKRWANKNGVPVAYISDSELRQKTNTIKEIFKFPFLKNYFSKNIL